MIFLLSNPSSARPKCEAVKIGEQSWHEPVTKKKPKRGLYVLSDQSNNTGSGTKNNQHFRLLIVR